MTKYLVRYRGSHVFNPSNVGLVVVFIVFGSTRVEPLDFWWAPLGAGMLVPTPSSSSAGSSSPLASGSSPQR